MRPQIRTILKSFLVLTILLPVILLFLVLERKPAVTDVRTFTSDDAVRIRAFIKTTIEDLLNKSDRALSLSATENDLNGLFAFGHRSISKISGKAKISSTIFKSSATIKIPHNPIGNYLNFHLDIAPSKSGFLIERAAIGKLPFSNSIVHLLAALFLDMAFGFNEGQQLLDAIDSVTLNETRIDVHLNPIPNMPQLVEKMRGRLSLLRDEVAIMGNPKKVRTYFAKLMEISEPISTTKPLSLAYYIGALFKEAQDRGGEAIIENRAAILALGIYFGSWRVEQMIGRVRTEEMKRQRKKTDHVGLAGRRDLRLHFIISAALEIASEQGISHAIGEFKELFDAREGGSGFSFVDLAADRAGVRFAQTATARISAEKIQHLLAANPDENLFFPSINDLPEGLSKEDFERYFGTIESERYFNLVKEVDHCLTQLPAYNDIKEKPVSIGCNIVNIVPSELL